MALSADASVGQSYFPTTQAGFDAQLQALLYDDIAREKGVSAEDIEKFASLVSRVEASDSHRNYALLNIITACAEPFFLEQITAEEAAELIDAEVSTYLSELK